MPINPNIALSVKPAEFESPLNAMAKVYALKNAAQENKLGQMKMDEYQQNLARQNALRTMLSGFTPDMNAAQQVSALQRGGFLPEARSLAESTAKVTTDERAAEKAQLESEAKRLEIRGQVYGSVAANPTPETAQSALLYLLNNKLVDENAAQQAWAQIQANPTPDTIRTMAQNFQRMSLSAKDQLALHFADLGGSIQPISEMTGETVGSGLRKTVSPGEVLSAETARRGQDIAAQTAANRLGLDRDKLGTGEELPPKEKAKREAAFPKISGAYRAATHEIDSLLTDITKLRDHPGLKGVTGLISGRTPNFTGAARAAQTLLDKIMAKGQFRGLQAMREASPTGGALGNVSDKEGDALRAAFGALSQTQDTASFKTGLDTVLSDLRFAKQNIAQTYEDTYSYRGDNAVSNAPSASAPPAAVSGVDHSTMTDAELKIALGIK
ncbi:MAG: hypothetical protein ACR2K1_04130 [Saprospiraceae bacterium]